MELSSISERLRSIYGGRPWLIAGGVLPECTGLVAAVREMGAERCFALADANGTGSAPDPADADYALLADSETDSLMNAIRRAEIRLTSALPPAVQARIDAFDPARQVRVIGTMISSGKPVADRQAWGRRPTSWQALEDKTIVDGFWDAASIPRAPSEVVEACHTALVAAAGRLDRGLGTVWVADNRDGFHGGASFVRWVRTEADAAAASELLGDSADRVRVMPFLEGIPCSIHGIVLPGGVVVLRPAEMVVLRRPESGTFFYARAGTSWDPPTARREEMRRRARRVGTHLATELGYRGVFTVDGVMTADGFLPTELNPRFGAALYVMFSGSKLPLYLMHLAIVEGIDLGLVAKDLEHALLEVADTHRRARCGGLIRARIEEEKRVDLTFHEGKCQLAREEGTVDARLTLGPSPVGGYLNLAFEPAALRRGQSVAPYVVGAFAFADTRWELGIGRLQPAPDVTAGGA